METHYALSDALFEEQFKNCQLNPALFNHEAHFRLAWIHIKNYGVEKAIENICSQLLNFVTHLGPADKYNKTLTIAAIQSVNHFISHSGRENFIDFIKEYPRLKNNFIELIAVHYKVDIFNSELAKKKYLEPDLLPFT